MAKNSAILALLILTILASGCIHNNPPQVSELQEIENNTDYTPQNNSVQDGQQLPNQPLQNQHNNSPGTETQRPLQQNREEPEIPSEAERATLPNCDGLRFTTLPVDLTQVYEIVPLGNLAPPGHTLPTEHTYMHFNAGGSSMELFALYAPADVYITSISRGTGFTQDPLDYTIYFALCRDVIGYYNHVKELSPALQQIEASGNCRQNAGDSSYQYCENKLDKINEGSEMGKVGRLQGNFDFGLIDISKTNNFTNPERYGFRSLHVQCPYDYYDEANKQKFFNLITRNDEKQCGEVMQDVKGTAQGNWFYANARADRGSDWDKYLSLVYDNKDTSLQVISIGGTFTTASVWKFTPQNNGAVNRNFSQVTPNRQIYCYDAVGQQGRILLQLASETELKIEAQSGNCAESQVFQNAFTYNR